MRNIAKKEPRLNFSSLYNSPYFSVAVKSHYHVCPIAPAYLYSVFDIITYSYRYLEFD